MTINFHIDNPAGEAGLRLTREDIEGETRQDVLALWFRLADETQEQIKEMLDAFKDAGAADAEWVKRAGGALGYTRIGLRWVERRMLALGFTPPYSPRDPRAEALRVAQNTIVNLKAKLDRLTVREAA